MLKIIRKDKRGGIQLIIVRLTVGLTRTRGKKSPLNQPLFTAKVKLF